jgi:Mn2+/Fe2+ NRAMP family transporter
MPFFSAPQVVLRGFMNVRLSTLTRRLLTRMAAIAPAALLQALYGDRGTYK